MPLHPDLFDIALRILLTVIAGGAIGFERREHGKAAGLRTTTIFGGVSQSRQVTALDAGVDIVVACPGRLEDLLNQKVLTLDQVAVTVLDEADHMADLGFLPGVRRILDRTPAGGQRMLFSATLDNGVDVLVRRYLSNPVHHSVDSAESPVAQMTHHVLEVADVAAKQDVVRQLADPRAAARLDARERSEERRADAGNVDIQPGRVVYCTSPDRPGFQLRRMAAWKGPLPCPASSARV